MKRKSEENILVVIAARGGSKGLKNKNVINIMGRPLIAYSILQALKWGKADRVICTTDSPLIAGIARKYGAEAPFLRSKRLSGDTVGKISVIRDAARRGERLYRKKYDIIVDLDVTAPIRKIKDIDECLKLFREKRPKSIFSVNESRKNPYFNMVKMKDDGRVRLVKKTGKHVLSRQSSPKVFDMNASIYVYARDYIMDKSTVGAVSDDSYAYVMDEISRFDIDNETDLRFTEFLMEKGIWKNEV